MAIAVYPGSFDPVTNGHLDIVVRAAAVFDRVVVGVLENPRKSPLLSTATRVETFRSALAEAGAPTDRVDVVAFDGLTVEFARAHGAAAIVRGLRAVGDLETELQLAHNNRILAPEVDTVCFLSAPAHGFISSSLVREIARFGGDVSALVPAASAAVIREATTGT